MSSRTERNQTNEINAPETFFTAGLSAVASRLRSGELDPPHASAALLLNSFKDEVVEVPGTLTERAQLFPHQARGVAELVARLRRFNTSVLADSVGLGKTRTTCALIRMLRDSGSHQVSAILTPKKLERNWRKEMSVVGLREGQDVARCVNIDVLLVCSYNSCYRSCLLYLYMHVAVQASGNLRILHNL